MLLCMIFCTIFFSSVNHLHIELNHESDLNNIFKFFLKLGTLSDIASYQISRNNAEDATVKKEKEGFQKRQTGLYNNQ